MGTLELKKGLETILCSLTWRGTSSTQHPGRGCPATAHVLGSGLKLASVRRCLLTLIVPCAE